MKTLLKPDYRNTIKFIAEKLNTRQYCIRGTCSLMLQGIDMNVDDIDILCDRDTALYMNEVFKDFCTATVSYKESPKFKSYFGSFVINSIKVECMGEWQIKDNKGMWSTPLNGNNPNVIFLDNIEVKVTKIEDELEMFLLMGRYNAYHKIKKQIKQTSTGNANISPQKSLFN